MDGQSISTGLLLLCGKFNALTVLRLSGYCQAVADAEETYRKTYNGLNEADRLTIAMRARYLQPEPMPDRPPAE